VLYGHPESIDTAAIAAMARLPNVLSYYDLPIQHASDAILRRMGRRYSADDLRALFARIRTLDPAACLRTTAIVGFPGESVADFRQLMALIEEVRFDHLGVFEYSDAEDLPSHRLTGHVALRTARRRRERLMQRQLEIVRLKQAAYVGQRLPVLLESQAEAGLFVGRTAFQAPEVDGVTLVRGHRLAAGALIMARITAVHDYDLEAEVA
jgi:ribosomal protein S12 methylthiotransferase